MPSVSAFWGVYDVSVSITCSSSRRSNYIVSLVAMSSTSIRLDRIKASDNTSQNDMVSLSFPITMMARSSPCQSWVDYTTITAEVLDNEGYEEAEGSRWWHVPHLENCRLCDPSPCFSDDDDKQRVCVFPWKNASRFGRWPLHCFAFLADEAAKQEVLEQINPSLFSVDDSWSLNERVVPS